MLSSKENCWSIAWVISLAIDPSNSLSWIGQVSVEWNFKGAKSGEMKHSVAPQSTRVGTGLLLICGTITESKKAAEEVDDKTAYKGSSSGVQVSTLVSTTVSRLKNLPTCLEVLGHFPTCHWLMVQLQSW